MARNHTLKLKEVLRTRSGHQYFWQTYCNSLTNALKITPKETNSIKIKTAGSMSWCDKHQLGPLQRATARLPQTLYGYSGKWLHPLTS